jgi:hypothetical protein
VIGPLWPIEELGNFHDLRKYSPLVLAHPFTQSSAAVPQMHSTPLPLHFHADVPTSAIAPLRLSSTVAGFGMFIRCLKSQQVFIFAAQCLGRHVS